jgi:hypothetical protein
MSTTDVRSDRATGGASAATVDMKLERSAAAGTGLPG